MTMNNTNNTIINCKELFAQFNNKREALILVFLLVEADYEGRINSSIYALARQLNMHRQTLTRTINHLCEKGYVKWEESAVTGKPKQIYVTNAMTAIVTKNMTYSPEDNSRIIHSESSSCNIKEKESLTPHVTHCVTKNVTSKEETKEKKEENSPAPLKEEKKQKKEENSLSPVREREKIPGRKTASTASLEQRRQQFIDSLMPYANRYGEEMIRHFGDYWTETNRSLTRMRFEMQPTWSTHLRLARWARNEQSFNQNNYQNHYSHDNTHKPTSADYIREAQITAINDTMEFIRQAEIRRGGVPPHLPF